MYPAEEEFEPALARAHELASAFLKSVPTRRAAAPPEDVPSLEISEAGTGATDALRQFWERFGDAFSGSSGPRYWGFVHGGVTPAAMAADWLCSTIDQTGQAHGDSPSAFVERDAIGMLRDLFGLPASFTGNFVSGGTMANAAGIAVGLQVLGAARGINVSYEGAAALGRVTILAGEAHASIAQAAALLGLGRNSIERLPLEVERERVNLTALAARLEALRGEAIIIVGNAGTVNTGDFDDLDSLGKLAEQSGAHFHVDGAFGLFAATSEKHAHLVAGIERAGTIAGDAHKWLNVPYDSGFLFARHLEQQIAMFKSPSAYLPATEVHPMKFQDMSPENSRRLRAIPAWVTLQAYGRSGYREIVQNCCGLAEQLGKRIAVEPGFRLRAPVRLNVLCFQLEETGSHANADQTRAFVDRLKSDGRILVTSSMIWGEPCIRAALVNWRTRAPDLEIAMQAFRDARK